MPRRFLALALILLACSRPPPPGSPGAATAGEEAAPPAAAPAATEADCGPGPFVTPPPAIVQQLQGQLVLEHPRVRPYLHLEAPANLPLTVSTDASLAAGAPRLTAGGQPVEVLGAASARLRLGPVEALEGPRVRIGFAIPAEGVDGHVDLALECYEWRAVDVQFAES